MKERPILLKRWEVRAIQKGITRIKRPITGRWISIVERCLKANKGKWVWDTLDFEMTTPFGVPGDRLWVRKTWALVKMLTDAETGLCEDCKLWTDPIPKEHPQHGWVVCYEDEFNEINKHPDDRFIRHWRPPLSMPRWASRTDLLIKDVSVRWAQDAAKGDWIIEFEKLPSGAGE